MACETLPARTSGCVRASSGGRKRTGNPLIAESCINLGASPAVAAARAGVERVSVLDKLGGNITCLGRSTKALVLEDIEGCKVSRDSLEVN